MREAGLRRERSRRGVQHEPLRRLLRQRGDKTLSPRPWSARSAAVRQLARRDTLIEGDYTHSATETRMKAQAVRARLARRRHPGSRPRRRRRLRLRRLDSALSQPRWQRCGPRGPGRALRSAAWPAHLRHSVELLAEGTKQSHVGRPQRRGHQVRGDPPPGQPRMGTVRAPGAEHRRGHPPPQVARRPRPDPLGQFHADVDVEHGVADEIVLFVYPVLLGTGKRFFAEGTPARAFELASTSRLPSGIVINAYNTAGPLNNPASTP